MKVFLGGTCNGSSWRETLIPMLLVDYFNPVVENWTPECQEEERRQRKECDVCLYVITPRMTGVFSIAEVVEDSNKRPEKTVLCILEEDGFAEWTDHQFNSMSQVARLVSTNGAAVFNTLGRTAEYINRLAIA
jgi:hypothetical protein